MLIHNWFFHGEYYRYLNCGYRLPVLGGTDKMSAEVPVGAVYDLAQVFADQTALAIENAQLRERAEHAHVAARHHALPFEPEVEQVTIDDQGRGLSGQTTQK